MMIKFMAWIKAFKALKLDLDTNESEFHSGPADMTFKTEIWDTSRDTDSLRLLGL
jgi:hypothetical protein